MVKVFIILFLLVGTPWQFSKQISKLSFQISIQIYFLLEQTQGERKAFYGGLKKGNHIVRLPPKALGSHKREISLSFCKILNSPTPPAFH